MAYLDRSDPASWYPDFEGDQPEGNWGQNWWDRADRTGLPVDKYGYLMPGVKALPLGADFGGAGEQFFQLADGKIVTTTGRVYGDGSLAAAQKANDDTARSIGQWAQQQKPDESMATLAGLAQMAVLGGFGLPAGAGIGGAIGAGTGLTGLPLTAASSVAGSLLSGGTPSATGLATGALMSGAGGLFKDYGGTLSKMFGGSDAGGSGGGSGSGGGGGNGGGYATGGGMFDINDPSTWGETFDPSSGGGYTPNPNADGSYYTPPDNSWDAGYKAMGGQLDPSQGNANPNADGSYYMPGGGGGGAGGGIDSSTMASLLKVLGPAGVAALLGGGASILGGVLGSNAASRAADTQAQSAAQAIAEQRRQFDLARSDNAPFLATGTAANARLKQLLGLDTTYTAPDSGSLVKKFSDIDLQADPVYQSGLKFGADQGRDAINARAMQAGNYDSGATLKALTRFGNDYGSTKANDAYNRYNTDNSNVYSRLTGTSGSGQVAVNTGATAGANSTNSIADTTTGAGNARAAGIVGGASAWGNALGGVASAANNYQNSEILQRLLASRGY